MLPCFPTVRNKEPLSLVSGSQKKREVGINASCPVSLKGTSGMSSERFNKQRKHTESQGAEVQRKTRIWEAARAWERSPQPSLPTRLRHISPSLSSDYKGSSPVLPKTCPKSRSGYSQVLQPWPMVLLLPFETTERGKLSLPRNGPRAGIRISVVHCTLCSNCL